MGPEYALWLGAHADLEMLVSEAVALRRKFFRLGDHADLEMLLQRQSRFVKILSGSVLIRERKFAQERKHPLLRGQQQSQFPAAQPLIKSDQGRRSC